MSDETRMLKSAAAIAGVGHEFVSAKDGDEPISGVELQTRACVRALEEAGVTRGEVGAFYTGRPPNESLAPQWNMAMIDSLKIAPKWSSSITVHGAGHLSALHHATLVLTTGLVDYALCVSGSGAPLWLDLVQTSAALEADPQFEAPYYPTTPSLYAQWATRYMHEFGVTPRQLAKVAVEHRKWAIHHPKAVMRDKGLITEEDVLSSRMIASPLHLLDCPPWYPGGIGLAVILTRSEQAERLVENPIYIHGFGECSTHEAITERLMLSGIPPAEEGANLTTTGAAVAAAIAYRMAGWSPADIEIVETQAPFTFSVLMALEDLGFCGKGEGGSFVDGGGIDFDGALPVNTSGGMLSFGQPSNTNPLLLEAMQQLRGQAMGRQVEGAKTALVHFHGGTFASHSVVLLANGREL